MLEQDVYQDRIVFDEWRGNGWHISTKNWTFAVRCRWYIHFVRPPCKPGYSRLYVGPFEIEHRRPLDCRVRNFTENEMIGQAIDAYEARYETKWQDAPPHCKKVWLDAWGKAMEKAICVVETYRVSVGNSVAGELAGQWTMENLREIREELREMVPNAN